MDSNSPFEIMPAVDIQDGKVVQLVRGERGTATEYGDPVTAARKWVAEGAESLHLIDLDGAFEGQRENAEAIQAIVDAVDVPVQVGGGIRTHEDAAALLEAGVERVILGTAAIEQPSLVETLSDEFPEGVVVSLDARADEVVVEGWTEGTGLDPATAAAEYADRGATAILFTDVDVEGTLSGSRAERVSALVDQTPVPVIASGGVGTIDDVRELQAADAAAVVVGTALYEGQFTLTEAIEAVEPD